MMSLDVIAQLQSDAGRRARSQQKRPLVFRKVEQINEETARIPNLGNYVPPGWHRAGRDDWFFVDKSGLGDESEPALTLGQFMDRLRERFAQHPDDGYAIVEEGQFQLYVAPFRKL